MFQVRIHGRGGQGVVTGAELLSVAAFIEGASAQAFPSFGSERMGAPVMAFCRIDHKEIRNREPVNEPDALIIQDPTLLHQVSVFEGLSRTGYMLINSGRDLSTLGIDEVIRRVPRGHACAVPATELALKHVGRPVPNAALLGGLCAVTGIVRLESVIQAIMKKFPGEVGRKNALAAEEAFALAGGTTEKAPRQGAVQHA